MSIVQKSNGTLLLNQGDSGYFHVGDLDAENTYDVYMAFTDKTRQIVGQQIVAHVENQTEVDVFIPTEITDLLTVPANKTQETYYYGVKVSRVDNDGNIIEDTVLPELGQQKVVIVYPKWVEGPVE